jgi:hypothetical protein
MGKNYTLYINQEPFANEENKSGLVNALLAQYYAQTQGESAKPEAQEVKPVGAFNFCEHNQVLGFCKKGCKG